MNKSEIDPLWILEMGSSGSDLTWRKLDTNDIVDNEAKAVYAASKRGFFVIQNANGEPGWVLRTSNDLFVGGRKAKPGDLMRDPEVRQALGLPQLPARAHR